MLRPFWFQAENLTYDMSSEVILQIDVIILLPPFVIYEYSFEIVCEKLSVGGQVQLEMPLDRRKKEGMWVGR